MTTGYEQVIRDLETASRAHIDAFRSANEENLGLKEEVDRLRRLTSTQSKEIEQAHEIMSARGIAECPAGTVCNHSNCNSKMIHRLLDMVDTLEQYRKKLEDERSAFHNYRDTVVGQITIASEAAPTHHPRIPGADADKPMTPQEQVRWLVDRVKWLKDEIHRLQLQVLQLKYQTPRTTGWELEANALRQANEELTGKLAAERRCSQAFRIERDQARQERDALAPRSPIVDCARSY